MPNLFMVHNQSTYNNQKCRCTICRASNAAYYRIKNRNKVLLQATCLHPHFTTNGDGRVICTTCRLTAKGNNEAS